MIDGACVRVLESVCVRGWRGERPSLCSIYLSAGLQLLTAASRANTKTNASVISTANIVYGVNIYAKWQKDNSVTRETETRNDQLPCWKQLFARPLCVITPTELLRGLYRV